MNAVSVQQKHSELILTVEEMRRFAFAYCMRRTDRIEDARDFGQEFVRMYLEKQQSDGGCCLGWHILNVRNLFLNFLRKRKKYLREIPVPDLTTDSCLRQHDRFAPGLLNPSNPQEYLERDDLVKTIEKVISKFSLRDQFIIRRKIQEYQSGEIVTMLPEEHGTVTPVNIDVIYHRFKRKLKKALNARDISVHKGDRR
ncbi:MAG TPA: hypothetical protein PLV45_15985 [bacterium]|nr:hypothetical protein [bacterium]